jgi:hypothetical protein
VATRKNYDASCRDRLGAIQESVLKQIDLLNAASMNAAYSGPLQRYIASKSAASLSTTNLLEHLQSVYGYVALRS